MSFSGTYTALVTPFRGGEFDEPAFRELIERQIAGGIDGVVPVGTTGESPTLSHAEHLEVIRVAIDAARGRCQVMAGTGSNSTQEAIAMTREAEKLGANSALLVAPYYNKPSQEGLFHHYQAIASSVQIPLVLYSIPGRCGIEISVDTVVKLAETCPNIQAIKEAGGNVERVSQLRIALPEAFAVLSGDDSLTLPFLSVGACGVISVASNLFPQEIGDLVRNWQAGEIRQAQALHRKFYPLFKDLFVEPNPVPAKQAMAWKKWCTEEVRLPLCSMTEKNRENLRNTLQQIGFLPTL